MLREALEHGPTTLRVKGNSMTPWIRPSDEVHVTAATGATVRAGEIVVFTDGGHLVVHRAIRRHRGGWVTRGDGRGDEDPWIADDRVVGVVTGIHLRWVHVPAAPRRVRAWIGRALIHGTPWIRRIARRVSAPGPGSRDPRPPG